MRPRLCPTLCGVKIRQRPRTLIVLILVASFVLAACGKTDEPSASGDTSGSGDATSANDDDAIPGETLPGGAPVTTKSGKGKKGEGGKGGDDKDAKSDDAKSTPTTEARDSPPTTLESDFGTPQDPGPMAEPAQGTYLYTAYRGTTKANLGRAPNPFRVSIDALGNLAGALAYVYKVQSDSSPVETHQYLYSKPDKLEFDRQVEKGATCDWIPDLTNLAKPLEIDRSWSSSSSCSFPAGPVTVTRKINDRDKITRWGRAKVGGTVVDCYVVERTVTLETSYVANGEKRTSRSESTETEWVAARFGVVAREYISTKYSDQNGKTSTHTFLRELQNLEPAPQ